MRSNTPARMHVIKKEEKEANLKAFIQKDLEARKASGQAAGQTTGKTYRLVARSLESPVARALTSLSHEIAEGGISVRMVLTQSSFGGETDVSASTLCGFSPAETRIIRDVRFLDAHEQLVVNPTSAWIGDCMRREPSKRDAYECFAPDCADIASWATTSFERLWSAGEPIELTPLPPAAVVEDLVDVSVLPIAENQPTHEASTRH